MHDFESKAKLFLEPENGGGAVVRNVGDHQSIRLDIPEDLDLENR